MRVSSLALVSIALFSAAGSACVVRVTEGDPNTAGTGGAAQKPAPNGANPTPAPTGANPTPAPTGTGTGVATAPTTTPIGSPAGVGNPGATPVGPGAAPVGGKPGVTSLGKPTGFLLRPLEPAKVIKQPIPFGVQAPAPLAIRGDVYAIAEGSKNLPANWLEMPILATLYTIEWNVSPRKFTEGFPGVSNRVEWFGIHWEGKFSVKIGGSFDLRLVSDDGARVWIDNVLVLDNDGAHAPKEVKGTSALGAGEHNLVIDYFQGPKYEIALQLFVKPLNQPERVFSTSF